MIKWFKKRKPKINDVNIGYIFPVLMTPPPIKHFEDMFKIGQVFYHVVEKQKYTIVSISRDCGSDICHIELECVHRYKKICRTNSCDFYGYFKKVIKP